jgi:nucleotide-binding universal stress UspA family protein
MIKRILLGLGGTPYTMVAIQRAVQLAKRFEAEITGRDRTRPRSFEKGRPCARKGDTDLVK